MALFSSTTTVTLLTVLLAAILSLVDGRGMISSVLFRSIIDISFIINFATDGVYLSLKGRAIANNSCVAVDEIGAVNNGGLLCHTNNSDCCRNKMGHWYYPGTRQTIVQHKTVERIKRTDYFHRNRGREVVRLMRVGNPQERGYFYCKVPNKFNETQTLYVNIYCKPLYYLHSFCSCSLLTEQLTWPQTSRHM